LFSELSKNKKLTGRKLINEFIFTLDLYSLIKIMRHKLLILGVLFSLFTRCDQKEMYSVLGGKTLEWEFPLKRTHTGMLIGNGVQGLMIWGHDNQLNITVGRAGFWDHRGGNEFASRTTFSEVKDLLYRKNAAGLAEAFAVPEKEKGNPPSPRQIGGGRIELYFPEEYTLEKGTLLLDKGTAIIQGTVSNGKDFSIRIRQSMHQEISWIDLPDKFTDSLRIEIVPSWKYVSEDLSKYGVDPPEEWRNENSGGFVQTLPDDPSLAMMFTRSDQRILLSTALGEDPKSQAASSLVSFDLEEVSDKTDQWWEQYWKNVPDIKLPDPLLQEIVDYGQYKQACVTPPQGLPCSLQGPFNEEYQLPPWSNDYHFNINIEMIYWPVLASNRLDHLNPLWEMIRSWWPQLTSNGEKFFQQQGAIMLPHAVDDRCQVVGTFWTGTIDHACTAWMAQLAWMHYRYSMDEKILEEIAWPMLNGAFEGYWAMMEEIPGKDGKMRLSLPVSVSPEFKGSRMDAWGRDASFQLAAVHMVAINLEKAAGVLEIEPDPRWAKVREMMPPYTTITGPRTLEWPEDKKERIALWEGMDLIESHRHHSYLAGIWPFMTYDPLDETHSSIVNNTVENWILKGPGLWSGWCVPWASIIHSRVGNSRAAIEWLHWWNSNFTNEGRGTLHDAAFRGTSLISSPNYRTYAPGQEHREIMQLDAGFGALSAVYEMLVQDRQGVVHILPGLPPEWKELSFHNILTEGGFLVSALISGGKIDQVVIEAQHEGTIQVAHGMGNRILINDYPAEGEIVTLKASAGQGFILRSTH
jgi:alpha-L-fucosidase 2